MEDEFASGEFGGELNSGFDGSRDVDGSDVPAEQASWELKLNTSEGERQAHAAVADSSNDGKGTHPLRTVLENL